MESNLYFDLAEYIVEEEVALSCKPKHFPEGSCGSEPDLAAVPAS